MIAMLLALMAGYALGADIPAAPQPPASNTVPKSESQAPLITHNPDGTFTVQKLPPKGDPKDAAHNGLVIKPQVVVPEIPSTANKH
jgi:hypothetical protein